MVLSFISDIQTADNLLQYSAHMAKMLEKNFAVLSFVDEHIEQSLDENSIRNSALKLKIEIDVVLQIKADLSHVVDICESNEISFLFLQLSDYRSKSVQKQLNACRDLRIPYLFFRNDFANFKLQKVLVPVSFLEEELEKAQFAAAFGRFCNAQILILQANDYGSKAQSTVTKMLALFAKFDFEYSVLKARKDSFKVDFESVQMAEMDDYDLIIASASREYGLDDIIFGSKEQKMVRKSTKPVLLINPRADLYALCD